MSGLVVVVAIEGWFVEKSEKKIRRGGCKRTKKTRPHGGRVLADSPERLDLEGGAVQFADVEIPLLLVVCAVVAGRSRKGNDVSAGDGGGAHSGGARKGGGRGPEGAKRGSHCCDDLFVCEQTIAEIETDGGGWINRAVFCRSSEETDVERVPVARTNLLRLINEDVEVMGIVDGRIRGRLQTLHTPSLTLVRRAWQVIIQIGGRGRKIVAGAGRFRFHPSASPSSTHDIATVFITLCIVDVSTHHHQAFRFSGCNLSRSCTEHTLRTLRSNHS